jgi:hypothetical protein
MCRHSEKSDLKDLSMLYTGANQQSHSEETSKTKHYGIEIILPLHIPEQRFLVDQLALLERRVLRVEALA